MKRAERREALLLVVWSVGGGLAQLAFLRWADTHLERLPKLRIAGPVFLVYVALVGWLLTRLIRARKRACPACPQCGVPLDGDSLRMAAATTRCDACGGQVIA